MPDQQLVLRRRRSPFQLALGGVLVVLVLVVEVLIFDAYANVKRTTVIFSEQSFLNTTLVNAQREAVLLRDQIEQLPVTGDVRGVTVRRGLLGNSSPRWRARAAATPTSGPPPPGPAGTWP